MILKSVHLWNVLDFKHWIFNNPNQTFLMQKQGTYRFLDLPQDHIVTTLAHHNHDWRMGSHNPRPLGDFSMVYNYMGVSQNRATPKWMVYNEKPY